MNSSMYRNLTITALLMALAIMIPIMMPLKVVIPPASYTLASHVPIFLAMFLSRKMTACVVIGSTLGFFVSGLPNCYCYARCLSYYLCLDGRLLY